MSSIYLFDLVTGEIHAFDCGTAEGRETTIQWTERAIESGAVVSDYGIDKPEIFPIEGIVTSMPFGLARNIQRVIDADASFRALAKKKQPVSLVTGYWAAEVVIEKVGAAKKKGEAEDLTIAMSCRTIELPKPQTTKIPASRLKPSKAKRSAPRGKGGAAAGRFPTQKEADIAGAKTAAQAPQFGLR